MSYDDNLWDKKPKKTTELLIKWDAAQKLIRDMLAIIKADEGGWLPIAEAKKIEFQSILMAEGDSVYIGYWIENDTFCGWSAEDDSRYDIHPTHFRYLPTPPKGNDDE